MQNIRIAVAVTQQICLTTIFMYYLSNIKTFLQHIILLLHTIEQIFRSIYLKHYPPQ